MINTAISSASAAAPAPSSSAQPAVAAAPADQAAPAGNAPAATPGATALPDAIQPFARWLGQQATVVQDALQPADPTAAAADGAQASGTDAPAAQADDTASVDAATPPPDAGLAAMAVPLMPLSPTQAAQALQAMLPAQGTTARSDDAPAAAAPTAADKATILSVLPGTAPAAAPETARASAAVMQAVAGRETAPAPQGVQEAGQEESRDGGRRAPVSLAALPRDQHAAGAAAVAVRMNVQAADGQDAAGSRGAQAPAGPAHNGTPAATGNEAAAVAGATAPTPAAPVADTVKLAGPPTAWRQSLQEALGDKLHLQVTQNVEQAVIRLEPPQLGRIDIAIRHSAGSLEVNITASNGEVLRQLQTVSDNLRSDLSQRQFTEVAVTVAPAPKSGTAAPFGDPQQQGRGRQPGREQDNEPGRALAEADAGSTAFTLAGRT